MIDESTDIDVPLAPTGCVMASLLRQIFSDIGMSGSKFDIYVNEYILKNSKPGATARSITNQRNSIRREIFAETITWRTFLNAMSILRVKEFTLTVDLDRGLGKVTRHEVLINNQDYSEDESKVTEGLKGLAILLSKIMIDIGVNATTFEEMVATYLLRLKSAGIDNRSITNQRNNIRREFFTETITWRVFMKGLKFVGGVSFKIHVEIKHPSGRVTRHTKNVKNF
jgi:hypothetical protein